MYQVTESDLSPKALERSPRNFKDHNGETISNATSMTVEELADRYVFPVTNQKPDTTWQTIIGNQTVNIAGEASKPREVVCTLEYQVQDITLEAAKEKLINQVKNHALQVQDGGYLWEKAPGESYVVDTKLQDRVNIVGLDNMAKDGDLADQLKFTMADDQEVPLTDAEFMTMAKAVGVFVITIHGIKKAKVTEVKNLPDLDACKDYDITLGFPQIPEIDPEIEP
jgi:hypothetical protein